jgi:ankyrin repeat protein
MRRFAASRRSSAACSTGVSTPKRHYGSGLTALMWAAGYEDGVGVSAAARVPDLLLEAGAQLDAVDHRGRTALMIAADLGHAELADMLIE